ncbi:SDR family oxidoreductase [Psychromonas sp. MME2]|uniref:SDR family NAD(P)-dependent oxidoreductase n=1 Tax=unclassified Psychromonas TaxID=2614957 RepID=UPI00339C9D8D
MKDYVLITGASAGLGEAFCEQLAQQGFSLLLVARREQRLIERQQQLLRKYSAIDVHIFPCDLSDSGAPSAIYDYLDRESLNLIGLINNAGFGQRGRFCQTELSLHLQIMQVNMNALVSLTYLAIPLLKLQPQSFIINVASTAAFQAGPNVAIYYASKAFVLSFTEALHEELKESHIMVSALCPGATRTEFATVADLSESLLFRLRSMSKEPVVSYSLVNRHKAVVIPGWLNKLGALLAQILPRGWARKVAFKLQK